MGLSTKKQSVSSSKVALGAPGESRLLEALRRGDVEAGRRFVQDHYPGIFRYLAHLTGRRDAAEDLTQETFLQAWRCLDDFAGRSTLRTWLCRIAHREFLQALRRQRVTPERATVPLDAVQHIGGGHDWTDAVELRDVIRMLPVEEGRVV